MNEHFEKILGPAGVSENPNDLDAYSYDASELPGKARTVLWPETDEQVRMILSYANRSNLDIVVRGNGSSPTGGATPQNSIVLCMHNYNHIQAINIREGWMHVECGVTLAEIQEAARAQGFRYPFDTSSRKLRTLGGLLAQNGLSKYSGAYGRPSDQLVSLEILDGTGKYFVVTKDFAEYTGLEGSAYVLLRAKIKLIPLRPRSADMAYFDTLPQAVEFINQAREKKPLSIEFLDSIAATYAGLNTRHAVLVEYENESGSLTYENYSAILHKRDGARRACGAQGFILQEDSWVPPDSFLEAIDWCLRHEAPVVAHAASGVIHPFFKRAQENLREHWAKFVTEHGGLAAGQFGWGITKKKFVPPRTQQRMRLIKERADYNNILGRGKIYDYV